MTYKPYKYEGWFYGLAFLIALAFRLIGLGHLPLNDAEARVALEALRLADGLKQTLSPNAGYILFTIPVFFLYGGGTDALARLIPALIGSALIFAPLLFRDRLRPRSSLILAFFIALDPGLIAISRQAASPILAVTFLVFALGFFNQKRFQLAGAFAALTLLGGPNIWHGLLGLALAWALYQAAKLRFSSASGFSEFEFTSAARKELLIAFAATLLIGGTLFFFVPNGLSSALASIPAYLNGWRAPSGVGIQLPLISLLAYQPFALLLAGMAIVRGWVKASRKLVSLSVWFFVAIVLALIYPARQVSDLAWALLPMYALAASELVRFVNAYPNERKEMLGTAALVIFLCIFGWLNSVIALINAIDVSRSFTHVMLALGAFFLIIPSVGLIALGWSVRIAQVGVIWGLGVALSLLSLAGAVGVTGLRGSAYPELWWQADMPLQANLLTATANDLSEWKTGDDHALSVALIGVDSPALKWSLREHALTVENYLDISQPPQLAISTDEFIPDATLPYRGQDFIWRVTTAWQTAQASDWVRWFTLREMPQTSENILLWANNDLFIYSQK